MRHRMKWLLSTACLTLVACQTTPTTNTNATVSVNQTPAITFEAMADTLVTDREVVVVVNTQMTAVDLEQQALEWGYSLKAKQKLEGLDMYVMTFDCPPGVDPYRAVVELERLQANASVGVSHKYTLQSDMQTVSKRSDDYADHLLNWPQDGCESMVNVGVIDGGLSTEALETFGTRISYRTFVGSSLPLRAEEHGHAITAILMSPRRVKNGDVFVAAVVSQDEQGRAYSGLVPMLEALDWMVQNDVKVINISLAGPDNRTLEKAIARAADKGAIIVAAVGNDGELSSPRYPAAYETVIATTAVDAEGQIFTKAVRGEHVDFAAPGVKIYIPELGPDKYVSGTSMAAPFVSALIASHLKNENNLSVNDIRMKLSAWAEDLGETGRDPIFGDGLVKAKPDCML